MANKLILIGRLTKDPELRILKENKVVNFTLAVKRDYKNKDGEYDVDFIDCQLFGTPAETFEKFNHKGSQVYVEGQLQSRSYTNNDGKQVKAWECNVNKFELLDTKQNDTQTKQTSETSNAPGEEKAENKPESKETATDDELPF